MFKKMIKRILFGQRVEDMYYSAIKAKIRGGLFKYWSMYISKKIVRNYGCYLAVNASVGNGLKLRHPIGIVIGEGVNISDDVTIYQNVTLGASKVGEGKKGIYPSIGCGTVIYAGSVIVGGVSIGEYATIGANSVVLTDVEDNSVVAGVPAKVIGQIKKQP